MSFIERILERRPAAPQIDPAVQHAMRIWNATGVVPVAHMVTDGSDMTRAGLNSRRSVPPYSGGLVRYASVSTTHLASPTNH